MTNLANLPPLGLKQPKQTKKKGMRPVAKGHKSSSDCPIMRSAKNQPCLADWCGCGGSTDTTCMRHIRKFGIGGMAMKPPNFIGFYGCQRSEDIFALKGESGWTWEGLMQALILTQIKLHRAGLIGATYDDTPPEYDAEGFREAQGCKGMTPPHTHR